MGQQCINITLWCDGLRVTTGAGTSRQKRQYQTNSDSDVDSGNEDNPPSKKKSKEDRVQKIVDDLKKQHGEEYTTMQYRIWAETVNGGMHKSTTEPPSSSMFNRDEEQVRVETKRVMMLFLKLLVRQHQH